MIKKDKRAFISDTSDEMNALYFKIGFYMHEIEEGILPQKWVQEILDCCGMQIHSL